MSELLQRLENFSITYHNHEEALRNRALKQEEIDDVSTRPLSDYYKEINDETIALFTSSGLDIAESVEQQKQSLRKQEHELGTKLDELKKQLAGLEESRVQREREYHRTRDSIRKDQTSLLSQIRMKCKRQRNQLVLGLICLAFTIILIILYFFVAITAALPLLIIIILITMIIFYNVSCANKEIVSLQEQSDQFQEKEQAHEKEFSSYHDEIAASKSQLETEIAAIEKQIAELDKEKPEVLALAEYLKQQEVATLKSELDEQQAKCDELYRQLKQSATIPSEEDWPRIDRIVKLVKTGRANSLSEALNLCDQEDRHNRQLAAEKKRLEEQRRFQEDERIRRENFEYDMQRQHEETLQLHAVEIAQQERQHKEQMTAAKAQIAAQAAEIAALLRKQNSN